MKATTIRGTFPLTDKVAIWCDGKHEHQVIQGTTKDGRVRTECAQKYPVPYCKRVARNVKSVLYPKPNKTAYPVVPDPEAEEEYIAESDPYHVPERISVEERTERILEEIRERRHANAAGKTSGTIPVAIPKEMIPKPKHSAKPPASAKTPAVTPLEESLSEAQRIAEETERGIEHDRPTNTSSSSAGPAEPDAPPPAPIDRPPTVEMLPKNATKYLNADRAAVLDRIVDFVKDRIMNGGNYTIQTGPRMKALQDVFGVPQNKVILAVSLLKKPATR